MSTFTHTRAAVLAWSQVAEARLLDVRVRGSLRVHADNVMGHYAAPAHADRRSNGDGASSSSSSSAAPAGEAHLRYSSRCGRVKLVNVAVDNAGIDWSSASNVYWKHAVARRESCFIELQGRAEFEAHNVTLQVRCLWLGAHARAAERKHACMHACMHAAVRPCATSPSSHLMRMLAAALPSLLVSALQFQWLHAHVHVCMRVSEAR